VGFVLLYAVAEPRRAGSANYRRALKQRTSKREKWSRSPYLRVMATGDCPVGTDVEVRYEKVTVGLVRDDPHDPPLSGDRVHQVLPDDGRHGFTSDGIR
jgi:hypothetical protein